MKKIKVGIVNYLNTAPLLYGLENSPVKADIELIHDYPSNLARKLINGTIDLGLVPVAVIPELKDWRLVGDYGIACNGPVASVCIFSEQPIDKVEKVFMDYQSRTSVELAKILLKDFWKVSPQIIAAPDDYREHIKGTTAGLVIGDRSFEQRKLSAYAYDLGEAWKKHTGLPFIFAAWLSNKELPEDFVRAFNNANKFGIENIGKVVNNHHYPLFDLHKYYTEFISYKLDDKKQEGLERFLRQLSPAEK